MASFETLLLSRDMESFCVNRSNVLKVRAFSDPDLSHSQSALQFHPIRIVSVVLVFYT